MKANETVSNRRWIIYTDRKTNDNKVRDGQSRQTRDVPPTRPRDSVSHFCRLGPTDRSAFISRLRDEALHGVSSHVLKLELLVSVKQYNVFVAMSANAASIGLSMESLRHDIPSPFNAGESWVMSLPSSLQPTALQRRMAHHPWIDLFPVASVRDTLLKHEGTYNDEELCHDLFGSCGSVQGDAGILIWGEAWDPLAYEISEKVIQKWLWMFYDCNDIIQSSNHWRAKRGEKCLFIPC
jgi:Domain of unknown function (DUF3425)